MTDEPAMEPLPQHDDVHAWVVAHARPRCEKKITEYCATRNVYSFLPLLKRKRRYGARIRINEVPLFPGYVFVLADASELTRLRGNQRVANLLKVPNQEQLVAQLNQVQQALLLQGVVELYPYLVEGARVMVRQGPMKGVEGVVLKRKSRCRVIINVDFIQQSVAVEIDADWLTPA